MDDEWEAAGGVDRDLAALRTCWKLATALVAAGTRHPWPASITADQLAGEFCRLLPHSVEPERVDDLHAAEAALRVAVLGGEFATHVAQLRAAGRRSVSDPTVGDGRRSPLRQKLAVLKRLPGGERLADLTRRLR